MTGLAGILALGFCLGMRHAADADHVVAVSTLVARNKRFGASWLLGAFWGIGHSATILAVGAAIILFRLEIPPRLGLAMEFAVGLVLVALGALNLAGVGMGTWGMPTHSHPHDHADPEHGHEHEPSNADPQEKRHGHAHVHLREARLEWLKDFIGEAGAFQLARSLTVGLIHGLAGSAAVALLVLAAIPSPRLGLVYLVLFGAGTLVGMLALSALMELAILSLARWWRGVERLLTSATGLASLLFGCYVLYHIGFAEGMFGANPHWTPQ